MEINQVEIVKYFVLFLLRHKTQQYSCLWQNYIFVKN